MGIKLYNTMTRSKEEFIPGSPPDVKMYICGPTVYDYIHIGNARVFIIFDVIRRYMAFRGYRVTMVQNYTDIDDKMIQRAAEQGITVDRLAKQYIAAYKEDTEALRIRSADIHPRATEHIGEIISLIEMLEKKGHAYTGGGDVYFDSAGLASYGQLSQQKREELLAGVRVEPGEHKKDPLDFVLWKKAKPGEPSWESPWGAGRPGWHIECSAMAMHYLGETIDIHAGGTDLVFPHHENEMAQSAGATGRPLALYWLHAGYLNIEEQKMSKSLGNVLTVRHLTEKYNPLDLRFAILSAHYRSPLNFGDVLMSQARAGRERLQEMINNTERAMEKAADKESAREKRLSKFLERCNLDFKEAMDDDFNTAGAIAALFDLAKEVNIYLKEAYPYRKVLLQEVMAFFQEANEVLEILQQEKHELDAEVEEAVARREKARQARDWAQADAIRDELAARGIILEDTPHGTRIKQEAGSKGQERRDNH